MFIRDKEPFAEEPERSALRWELGWLGFETGWTKKHAV